MNSITHKPINLATKKGRKEVCNVEGLHNLETFATLEKFITKNEAEVVYKKSCFVYHDGSYYIISNGVVDNTGSYSFQNIVDEFEYKGFADGSGDVHGVVIKQESEQSHYLFIANGDYDFADLVEFAGENGFPTLSFNCLNRFFAEEGIVDTAQRITSGKLRILDISLDSRIPMNSEELFKFQEANGKIPIHKVSAKTNHQLKPPQPGFTAIDPGVWHRPATLLFYDKSKKRTLLFGQDEGAYFGCDVPGNPTTIGEAFDALIPEKLRNRIDTVRQGEWFLAPVSEEDVPPVEQALVTTKEFNLPIEHASSNYHHVTADFALIFKTGEIYAKTPCVDHTDHAEVCMEGWCSFHRNLAKQSFSEEGVD